MRGENTGGSISEQEAGQAFTRDKESTPDRG